MLSPVYNERGKTVKTRSANLAAADGKAISRR